MKVCDVVRLNRTGKFERAIQLAMFREPEQNKNLCSWFVFTKYSNEKSKDYASVNWLERLRRGIQLPETGSVTCLVANYGHGKSHFGVLAANCFGMRNDSEEFKIAMEQLKHASVNDASAFENFRSEDYSRPYFVLCLQGDNMPTLRQAVFQEVERELLRHPETSTTKPPLWHADALNWLKRLTPEKKVAASQWLEKKGWDINHLETKLLERDAASEVREFCRELSKIVEGHVVDFGSESSVQDLLQWVLDSFCNIDGPFSGLIVLFDEFHVFVNGYAQAPEKGNPLQNLLNVFEIKKNHGRSMFCALATMDPIAAAQSALKKSAGDGESILKELNRIGVRATLKCEMESVLDSLLQQQDNIWEELRERCRSKFGNADRITRRVYESRFRDLNWDDNEIFERVTKGCFPLHPLTTTLLANLKFKAVQNPRSVLAFVQDQFNSLKDDDAVIEDWPNWVYGTDFFDTFHEMFEDRHLGLYRAVDSRLGDNATDEQLRVLVSMLLILAGRLKYVTAGYENVVAELSGLELNIVTQTLDALYKNGYIERDTLNNGYSFAEIGQAKADFKKAVNDIRLNLDFKQYSANGLTQKVAGTNCPLSNIIQPKPGNVEWGDRSDWAFTRYLVTKSQMTEEFLRPILRIWNSNPDNGTKDWIRAVELVMLPENMEDVIWAKANGPALISQMAGIARPPVLLSVLKTPNPGLIDALKNFLATEAIENDVRTELGEQYTAGRTEAFKSLADIAKTSIAIETNFTRIVGANLTDVIGALESPNYETIKTILLQKAYHSSVPKFVTTSGLGSNSHRKACMDIAQRLLSGHASDFLSPTGDQRPAADILQKYILQSWGMVDEQFRLKYPSNQSISKMWDLLNNDIQPSSGAVPLIATLQKLANPEYGLDTCTLCLVVSGWLGWNKSKLKIFTPGGGQKSWDDLRKHDYRHYLNLLSTLKIRRQDVGELRETIETICRQSSQEKVIDLDEAKDWCTALEEFSKIAEDDDEFKERCIILLDQLRNDIRRANQYLAVLTKAKNVKPSNDLGMVYELIDQFKKLEIGLVRDESWSPPSVLYKDFIDEVTKWIPALLLTAAKVKKREDVGLVRDRLQKVKNRFATSGIPVLEQAAALALQQLEETNRGFDKEVLQRDLLERVKSIKPSTLTLKELRREYGEISKFSHQNDEFSESLLTALTQKINTIQTEIDELIQKPMSIRQQLDSAKSANAVAKLQNETDAYATRLENSNELLAAEDVLKSIDLVHKVFRRLDSLSERIPSSRHELEEAMKEVKLIEEKPHTEGLRAYAPIVQQRLQKEFNRFQIQAQKEYHSYIGILTKKSEIEDIEEARRYLKKPNEYLSDDLVTEIPAKLKAIDSLLEGQRVDQIKSWAKKVKDKDALKELVDFFRQLAGGE